jgi:DNA repair protein RadA/Sms
MAKLKIQYSCIECGAIQNKWAGKCDACGEWNCLEEIKAVDKNSRSIVKNKVSKAIALKDVSAREIERISTGNSEVDRVLGGGLTADSLLLLGGDPGIGKSTILLQLLNTLATAGHKCLYASGEESAEQVLSRSKRLEMPNSEILFLAENSLDAILKSCDEHDPKLVVIDSIQTVFKESVQSAPGSITQVRECTMELMQLAKGTGKIVLLVGHVTKEGQLAGPKHLEHMVDTVIYFEGDKQLQYRMLRSIKNRFGAAGEIGVLEMTARGLFPVDNPSKLFIDENRQSKPGSVASCIVEGTRNLAFEMQSLVCPQSYAVSQRVALGVEPRRLTILLALLEKFAGLELGTHDVFTSVSGALKINDPGCDLALALAVASSLMNKTLPPTLLVLGEVGLGGEVRPVSQIENRLKECARMGFNQIILPLSQVPKRVTKELKGVKFYGINTLEKCLDIAYDLAE